MMAGLQRRGILSRTAIGAAAAVAGGALLGWGAAWRSLSGAGLLAAGALLLVRGSSLLRRVAPWRGGGIARVGAAADRERRFGEQDRDLIDEASWESFPASDPPSWTARR